MFPYCDCGSIGVDALLEPFSFLVVVVVVAEVVDLADKDDGACCTGSSLGWGTCFIALGDFAVFVPFRFRPPCRERLLVACGGGGAKIVGSSAAGNVEIAAG